MTKQLCSIILLGILTNLASGQNRYLPINPPIISADSNLVICIENIGLSSFCDSNFNIRYLQFSTKDENYLNPKIIDSVDCSPYSSDLIVYKTKKGSDYLILWTSESEYTSDIMIYYLKDDKLTKIGPLLIQNDCETCDDAIYPIEWIKIFENNNQIVIEPTKPFKYNLNADDWQKFTSKKILITIDKIEKVLRVAMTGK